MKKALQSAIKEGLEIAARKEDERARAAKEWAKLEQDRKQKQKELATKWFEENEASFYDDIKDAVGNGFSKVLYLEHDLKLPKTFTLKDLRDAIGRTSGLFCMFLPAENADGPGDDNYNRIEITWLLTPK